MNDNVQNEGREINDQTYATTYLKQLLSGDINTPPDLTRLNGLGAAFQAIYESSQSYGIEGAKSTYAAFSNTIPELHNLLQNQPKRFYHADELHLLPRPLYLKDVEPLYQNSMNMLVGASGLGKSFVALDWALKVAQSAPVIYIAAEGAGGYRDRVAAWKKARGMGTGQLYFAPGQLQITSATSVEEFAQGLQEFLSFMGHLMPALIAIDTLARCFGDGDENTAQDMNRYVAGLALIQQKTGAATLTLHHTTKSGNTERGSGVLRVACDSVIELTAHDDLITLTNSKNKYGKEWDDIKLRLVDFELEDGITCPAVMPSSQVIDTKEQGLTRQQRIILENLALEVFLKTGAKSAVLLKATGIPDNSLYRVLSKLKQLGYITQSDKGDPYFISADGLKAIGS